MPTFYAPGKLQQRVQRAIPPPPLVNAPKILSALWVLESESAGIQGTAFNLEDSGTITCAHSVKPDSIALRPDSPGKTFKVSILRSNPTIDLAVIGIDSNPGTTLERGNSDALAMTDYLTVAGFPNYRLGDSGHIAPGIVTGFRAASGIRRILTNAFIVAGTSGGPALSADGKVIGVAVTGADDVTQAQQTENHGIIPIDALGYLVG